MSTCLDFFFIISILFCWFGLTASLFNRVRNLHSITAHECKLVDLLFVLMWMPFLIVSHILKLRNICMCLIHKSKFDRYDIQEKNQEFGVSRSDWPYSNIHDNSGTRITSRKFSHVKCSLLMSKVGQDDQI